MPELRRDPITGRLVYVAAERALRPGAMETGEALACTADDCPFCEGHESYTPNAVAIYPVDQQRSHDTGWSVRVVPNKYPAVSIDSQTGFGAHEVVIEDPRHVSKVGETTVENQFYTLCAQRDRLAHWRHHDSRYRWGLAFKNVGAAAGASLAHLHSQLMVLPIIPPAIHRELRSAAAYFKRNQTCVYCDLIEQEYSATGDHAVEVQTQSPGSQASGSRIVAQDEDFVAFCPFAARMPFETWIHPRRHAASFDRESDDSLRQLARFQYRVLSAVESLDELAGYNVVLHSAPFERVTESEPDSQSVSPLQNQRFDGFDEHSQYAERFDTTAKEHYHWRIEVIPRQVKLAGFELGTSLAINPVPPERAATILRSRVVSL